MSKEAHAFHHRSWPRRIHRLQAGGRSSVPSMGVDRRCKSSGELVAATHTNRKASSRETGPVARPALKEAGSETAS